MEQRIDEQTILLQEKRERADAVLSEYQAEQSVCKDNLDQMWTKCNQCITQKCLNFYADNCEAKLAEKIEEDEVVPPCRQKPNSPCNSRNKPPTPRVSGSMQIIVNGKPVSNMDDALEHIKEQMAKTVTPPCEPGSKFEQFNSLVSMSSSSSGPKQVSQTTSKTISGTAGDGNSIGKMLLEQSENYSPDDRVNIGINMNGQVHNFTSFGQLFSNQQIMAKLDELDERMSKFGMKTDRQVTQRKESQPSRQTFTYSTSSRSGSAPTSDSTIRQSGCGMSPESAGGLPAVQQSAIQSPCSQQSGGERDELEETQGSSCGGCKTYQHVPSSTGAGSDAIMNEINAKLNSMMSQATTAGQTQVNFKSSSTGGQPTAGLSEQIIQNGQLSPDGNTFSYSWASNGTGDIDLDEIMSLLTQKFDRMGPSLSRSTRNIKEQLTRHQGPISLDRTKRVVSQCAIEQAAREAQIERAKKLAALAKRGGFDDACSMLTRTYGQAVTDKLVEQFFTQIRERVRKVKEMCEAAGNCGSTEVHINFKAESNDECGDSEPNCPNAPAQAVKPQQPAEQPEEREPGPDSSLNRISARLQSWSQSSSGSWSTSTSSKTSSSGTVTKEETKPQPNTELNVNQGEVKSSSRQLIKRS